MTVVSLPLIVTVPLPCGVACAPTNGGTRTVNTAAVSTVIVRNDMARSNAKRTPADECFTRADRVRVCALLDSSAAASTVLSNWRPVRLARSVRSETDIRGDHFADTPRGTIEPT